MKQYLPTPLTIRVEAGNCACECVRVRVRLGCCVCAGLAVWAWVWVVGNYVGECEWERGS